MTSQRFLSAFSADPLLDALEMHGSSGWKNQLDEQWHALVDAERNADFINWTTAVNALPDIAPAHIILDADTISIGKRTDLDDTRHAALADTLRILHPWRKGPFDFFGIHIDTEWRSDWKWQRIAPHISPLKKRRVLDVGCGSGYHAWRMRGAGAAFVLGIDPALLNFAQFAAVKCYARQEPVYFAPVKLEDMPMGGATFDTVFSMGVLYHRRDPFAHLTELMAALRPGGELILETLVVEGDKNTVLRPADRYAKMRNVFSLPSTAALADWLLHAGFRDVRLVNVNITSTQEQRQTDWMCFLSLADFLDPDNPGRTVEGHPAPMRATFIATKPA